jgi:hypothetical protein
MKDEGQITWISAGKDRRNLMLTFSKNAGLPVIFLKQTNLWENMSENSSEKPNILSNFIT